MSGELLALNAINFADLTNAGHNVGHCNALLGNWAPEEPDSYLLLSPL